MIGGTSSGPGSMPCRASSPRPADVDSVVAGLHAALTAVTFADRDTDTVTELLIEAAASWAAAQGWRVYRRAASVMHLPPPYETQHLFLDLACARPAGPPIAIEVDHTARRRTVDKLLEEAVAGRIPIWSDGANGTSNQHRIRSAPST